ncbi:unnamed protein product [Vitrella brassicaformis CCMP3155]|uniref:Uncharacterized protein n=1 Tax=Vitrella brassicaformis (strain CCMP3155) TaxID=1169540 RepID=A0A0G4FES3_VITBC|nr:unnamed protein product [Vitrella brassicaformis CCMP3155]|eukprot:CEM11312.1 unnamed protein product [Vitrella brassicaformis CCMP3155]
MKGVADLILVLCISVSLARPSHRQVPSSRYASREFLHRTRLNRVVDSDDHDDFSVLLQHHPSIEPAKPPPSRRVRLLLRHGSLFPVLGRPVSRKLRVQQQRPVVLSSIKRPPPYFQATDTVSTDHYSTTREPPTSPSAWTRHSLEADSHGAVDHSVDALVMTSSSTHQQPPATSPAYRRLKAATGNFAPDADPQPPKEKHFDSIKHSAEDTSPLSPQDRPHVHTSWVHPSRTPPTADAWRERDKGPLDELAEALGIGPPPQQPEVGPSARDARGSFMGLYRSEWAVIWSLVGMVGVVLAFAKVIKVADMSKGRRALTGAEETPSGEMEDRYSPEDGGGEGVEVKG